MKGNSKKEDAGVLSGWRMQCPRIRVINRFPLPADVRDFYLIKKSGEGKGDKNGSYYILHCLKPVLLYSFQIHVDYFVW